MIAHTALMTVLALFVVLILREVRAIRRLLERQVRKQECSVSPISPGDARRVP